MALTAFAVAMLLAAAWAVGAALLSRFAWSELQRFERTALELTAGFGAVALMLSATLLLEAFQLAIPLLVIAACAGGFVARRNLPRSRRPRSGTDRGPTSRIAQATALAICACAVLACAGAVAPVTDHDALSYVVPIANHIAREGALRVWTDQAPSMWPQAHTVLLAFIVRTGGNRLAALSAIEWLIAIGAISALARRACVRGCHAPLAVALTIAAPAAAFQVAASKEDMLLVAATAAALFCLTGPRTTGEAAAAGLFAGIAAGAKYPGLGVAIAVIAWIAIAWRGQRRRATVAAVACAVAMGGVWYLLNSWRFGNPVAPFVFGAAGTPLDAETVRATMDNYGGGRGLLNAFLTPFRIFLNPGAYGGRAALIHPLAGAAVAALFVPPLRSRHAPLVFSATVLYVGWYLMLQHARLLLPAVVALAPAAADVLAPAMRRSPWTTAAVGVSLAVPLLLAPTVGIVRAGRYAANPETYLLRQTEHYSGVEWANGHLDASKHRLLSMFGVVGYFTVPAIGLDPLHQLEFERADVTDHRRLLAACRRQRVTHIFTARHDLADVESQLRLVFEDPESRRGDAHFFRSPPSDATAIFEILPDAAPSADARAGRASFRAEDQLPRVPTPPGERAEESWPAPDGS
jgi:hypothetical protein